MGTSAYTVDRDFCIPRENVEAALAAVNSAFEQKFADLAVAVQELTCFEDNETNQGGAFILGRHQDSYVEDTEKLLGVLGAFAPRGSYVRFEGQDGDLFGFRVVDGRLREESGDYVWTLNPTDDELPAAGAAGETVAKDAPHIGRERSVVAPLVFSRDPEAFDAWWVQLARDRRDEIGELLAKLRAECCDVEFTLHSLALAAFQAGQGPGEWLHVQGLRSGLKPGYLMLDIDPSHGTSGECDGVEVVLTMHVEGGASAKYLQVSVFEGFTQALVPAAIAGPREQFAATVDVALAMVNGEIAKRDDFTESARDVVAPTCGNVGGPV